MLIDIVVPVYNVEPYLHRCIESVLAQTFSMFRLILVNDGSKDSCGNICDEYAKKDCRIHVIHKSNGGLSDARNVGIEWALSHSNSEYITFIDSDDWVHARYLELMYEGVRLTNCSLVICDFQRIRNNVLEIDEKKIEYSCYHPEEFYCYKNVNSIVAWGKLFLKSAFKNIRFPVGRIHEDEYTIYKILFSYARICFINQPLYAYYLNDSGITSNQSLQSMEDKVFSLGEQVAFFDNKWNKAFEIAFHAYYSYLVKFFQKLENEQEYNKSDYKRVKREFKKRLKQLLRKYHISIADKPDCYAMLFPKRARCYWIIKSQLDKIALRH